MSPSAVDYVLASLREVSGLKVYDGRVPVDPATNKLPARPYVVVYGPGDGDGVRVRDSLSGTARWREGIIQTTIVGDSAESVRIISRLVVGALVDKVPSIDGRVSFPIVNEDSQIVRRDDDVQPPVLYGVERWLLQSVPA